MLDARRVLARAALLVLVGLLAVAGTTVNSHAQGTVNFDIDPDTTGNTRNTLGTIEDCVEITVASPVFDGIDDDADGTINDGCPQVGDLSEDTDYGACADALDDDNDGKVNDGCPTVGAAVETACDTGSDYNIDIVVTGDTLAPKAYDASLNFDSSKVHIAAPGTNTRIKMTAGGATDLTPSLPSSTSPIPFAAAYLGAGQGTAGNGTIVRVGLDIGASGLVTFSLNPSPLTAYRSALGAHAITLGSGKLAINTPCLDDDQDGVLDDEDNCPLVANPDQLDTDGDGLGDLCDPDADGDTIPNETDNCVTVSNPLDNCPLAANSDQLDTDGDGSGDLCDPDADGDTVADASDNCLAVPNPGQADGDSDGLGDACDPAPADSDADDDTVLDGVDTCVTLANPDQTDTDGDGLGDACDVDDDNDGFRDACTSSDSDSDGIADITDNCLAVANPGQDDADVDGAGDACDPAPGDADGDDDGWKDGIELYLGTDSLDNCPDNSTDDAWPLDQDKSKQITVAGDVFKYWGPVRRVGTDACDANWRQRLDLERDGLLSVTGDIFKYRGMIGTSCSDSGTPAPPAPPPAAGPLTMGFDMEITGNSASALGSIDGCYEVAWGGMPFDGSADWTIDVYVSGLLPSEAPLAYDAWVAYDSAKVRVVSPTDPLIKLPGNSVDLSDTRPDSDGQFTAGAAYLSGSQGTAGNGALVRLALDIGGDGYAPFSLVGAALNSTAGKHAVTAETGWLAINRACPAADVIPQGEDNCSLVANHDQTDTDADGQGDLCDGDADADTIPNASDNCVTVANPGQEDGDSDGLGDVCDPAPADPDADGDTVLDGVDTCVTLPDPDQTDTDGDGLGNPCDLDDDNDGQGESVQPDGDSDGLGDACDPAPADPDADADTVLDGVDTCVTLPNPEQTDTDSDRLGNACDPDDDNDGIADGLDNCPLNRNRDQADMDGDGLGDACDDDSDGDTFLNVVDNCPMVINPSQSDTDADGTGDVCELVALTVDARPSVEGVQTCASATTGVPLDIDVLVDNVFNLTDFQMHLLYGPSIVDATGVDVAQFLASLPGSDVIDFSESPPDDDGDYFVAASDWNSTGPDGAGILFRATLTPLGSGITSLSIGSPILLDTQAEQMGNLTLAGGQIEVDGPDTDGDGLSNLCDPDDDGDTVLDLEDNCPLVPNPDQTNTDVTVNPPGDALGDVCDPDDDNDGLPDVDDPAPLDPDADDDTILDGADNCVLVANPDQIDTDGDSQGDACDLDDDNDSFGKGPPGGFCRDEIELYVGTDPLDPCADTATANDEADDKWPPDFNDDQKVDILDIPLFRPHFRTASPGPGYDVRFDLNADGRINVLDIPALKAYFNTSCQ